jgi:dihydrofolate synthase/folylpolyglutamate synthase
VPRGIEAETIAQIFKEKGCNGQVYSSVNEAFSTAKAEAKEQDLIFVGGSTFVVAEVL